MSNKYEGLKVESTQQKEQRNKAISDALGANKEVESKIIVTEFKYDREGNVIVDKKTGKPVLRRKKLGKRFDTAVMKVAGPGRETQSAKRARLKEKDKKKVRDNTGHSSCGNVGCRQCNPFQNMRLVGKKLAPLHAGNPQVR